MIKHFYSYIVETDSIVFELEKMDISEQEKKHLISLVDSTLHHAIVDTVLSELSEEDKKTFLHLLHTKNHEKVWKLLNARVENIEEKIKKAANDLKRELHKDIKEAKNR